MNRREALAALAALGGLALPLRVRAQTDSRVRRLGFLSNLPEQTAEERKASGPSILIGLLSALGWVEGRNLAIEFLRSDGKAERLPALVAELMRRRVDLIVATTTASAVAAARATKTVPIVIAGATAYPVECGLIESFRKPGGNVTGVAFFQGIEVQSKLAQFAREILPAAKRLEWVAFPPDLVTMTGKEFRPEGYYTEIAGKLGFTLGYHECRNAGDIDTAIAAMRAHGAKAAIFEPAGLSVAERERKRIGTLAREAGIATIFSFPINVAAGGLLSYGPVWNDVQAQTATYIDRILRGVRPSELPVEMPNKLQLVVNLQTAKALGITIPQSLLLRADRVIE